MGVSHYSCISCEKVFPSCSPYYTSCEGCGTGFCSEKCAKIQSSENDENCTRCRNELITDSELLEFILRSANSSRKEWEEDYREYLNDKDK